MMYVNDAIGQTIEAAFVFHFIIQLGVIGVFMVLYISVGVDNTSDRGNVDSKQWTDMYTLPWATPDVDCTCAEQT